MQNSITLGFLKQQKFLLLFEKKKLNTNSVLYVEFTK